MKALRREDPRLLRGGGRYVADIELASMRYVAFVRSPVAHADVNGVELPRTLLAGPARI